MENKYLSYKDTPTQHEQNAEWFKKLILQFVKCK